MSSNDESHGLHNRERQFINLLKTAYSHRILNDMSLVEQIMDKEPERKVLNIMVTGGTGFIGSHLCRALLKAGHVVYCVDNNYSGNLENIRDLGIHPNFAYIKHDINHNLLGKPELLPQFSKIDQIYNLACPASPQFYQGAHAIETTKTCVIGTLNMLMLAHAHNATFLQASTSEVYGDPLEHPQKETYRGNVNPIGIRACYDEGKRCAESLCFDYERIHDVSVKVVRIFNTYGPNMNVNDGRVVSNFICQALRGDPITIYGDGSQTRSFCYVDDLVRGLIAMMNSPRYLLGPVNLGNPNEFTIKELAEKVIKYTHSESEIVYKDLPSDDPTRRQPDITRAKTELGWEPTIMLDEGINLSIPYFAKRLFQ